MFKRIFTAVLMVGALIAAPTQAKDITIGALFALSGPNASYGDIFSSGVNLAADHINTDKLLDGKLIIQYEDSAGLPQPGVIGMNKLINVHKVPYTLVAFTSVCKAVSPIATRTKTVVVNGGGVSSDLAKLGPYFWNTIPLVNFEVRAMVSYLVKERSLKRFVLVYMDDPAGQSVRDELKTVLPTAGGQLIEALSVPIAGQQFSGIAARVRAANPDVVYIASQGSTQVQLIKQLRDNGIKQQLVSWSGVSVPEIHALPEAIGTLYTTQKIEWGSTDPVTKRFVDDYKAKYSKMPTAYAANYYNSVRLFGLLAQRLQKEGKSLTGENLLAQRIETKAFDLVGGKVTINENGTVVVPMQINQVDGKGGKLVGSASVD